MCCNPAPWRIPAPPPSCAPIRPWRRPISATISEDRMDLILRNARLIGSDETTDIGITGGKIAVIEANLAAEGETVDLGGRLVSPGLIETHIHLDKSCILDRVKAEKGDLDE